MTTLSNQPKLLKLVFFKGADIFGAYFTDAILEDVDFFVANVRDMILAEGIKLPSSNNDLDHIKFYHSCTHPKAKALLKIILEPKGINLEGVII